MPVPPVPGPPPGGVPSHGLCSLDAASTAAVQKGPWRGMTHYNQFLCAHIVSGTPSARNEVQWSSDGSLWEAQTCALVGEDKSATGSVPRFACTVDAAGATPADGATKWLARRYQPYATEAQYGTSSGGVPGCVDEGIEWSALCSGDRSQAIGNKQAFGQLICGLNCARSEAYYSGTYWVCAHPVASGFSDGSLSFNSPHYSLSGEVPIAGNNGTQLQSSGCPASPCYSVQ
jgi:hypothetical protein